MNLTELSNRVRKALPYVILGLLGFLIIFYCFKLYFAYLESSKPATVSTSPIFGKINSPFLGVSTSSANLNFTLYTIEGVPVTSTDSAKVYFLPKTVTRFGYREKIYLMAKAFGFDTDINYKLNGQTAVFDDGNRKLTIDITNFNFNFQSNFSLSQVASSSVTLAETDITNKAIDFLKSTGRYPDELTRGTTNLIYLKYDPILRDFVNVQNGSQAQAVEVDFFRPDIDNISVVTPRFFNSQNYVIMIFQGDEEKIIRANVTFFEKSEDQFGIYPVIDGATAWQKLKEGYGIVVAGQKGMKNITIKNMSLKYLDPDIYQSFLQPVYVFLGENDFVSYVPAIKDEYLQ